MFSKPSVSDGNGIKHSLARQSEEPEHPHLLPPLREFEIAFIARYLSTAQKLTIMALLNSKWRAFMNKGYGWSKLPIPGVFTVPSDYNYFLERFSQLTVIEIPALPADILTPDCIQIIEQCKRIGHISVESEENFHLLSQHPQFQQKLRGLSIDFKITDIETTFDLLSSVQFWGHLKQLQSLELKLRDHHDMPKKMRGYERIVISLLPLSNLKSLITEVTKPYLGAIKIIDLPSTLIEVRCINDSFVLQETEVMELPYLETLEFALVTSSILQPTLKSLILYDGYQCGRLNLLNIVRLHLCKIYQNLTLSELPNLAEIIIQTIQSGMVIMTTLKALQSLTLNVQCVHLHQPLGDRIIQLARFYFLAIDVDYTLKRAQKPLHQFQFFPNEDLSLHLLNEEQKVLLLGRKNSLQVLSLGSKLKSLDLNLPEVKDLFIDNSQLDYVPETLTINLLCPKLSYLEIDLSRQPLNLEFYFKLRTLKVTSASLTISGIGKAQILDLHTIRPAYFKYPQLLNAVKILTLPSLHDIASTLENSKQTFRNLKILKLSIFDDKLMRALFAQSQRLEKLIFACTSFLHHAEVLIPYSKSLKLVDLGGMGTGCKVRIERVENGSELLIKKRMKRAPEINFIDL